MRIYSLISTIVFHALLCIGCASSSNVSTAELKEVLPLTADDVHAYIQNVQESFEKTIETLAAIPAQNRTYENTIRPWNREANALLAHFGALTFLTQGDFPTKSEAARAMRTLQIYLYASLLQNTDLYKAITAYAEISLNGAQAPNPYENYVLQHLLDSSDSLQNLLSKEEQDRLAQLKTLNAAQEKRPFVSLKGQVADKTSSEGALTVLSLNTCFVPGGLCLIHGGVLPWSERVASLSKKICSINADVVCLQEVHGEDAAFALYDGLKADYAYFYISIGPRPLGFSLKMLGLPSGLFVASKYPIEDPQFTLFSSAGYPMNWGVFDFVVKDGTTSLGHIYTTHMQSLDMDPFPQVRAAQMLQTIEKMQSDMTASKETMPFMLCGDLNIVWGSNEPAEAVMTSYFYDAYNQGRTQIGQKDWTCTYYLSNYFLSPTKNPKEIDPNFQILDYALIPQSQKENYSVQTAVISMSQLSTPGTALSDHQGLLATIKPRKN